MKYSRNLLILFLTCLFFLPTHFAHSKMYQWKDDKGVTHFTDNPKKIPRRYRNKNAVRPETTRNNSMAPASGKTTNRKGGNKVSMESRMQRLKGSSLMLKRDFKGAEKVYGDLIKANPNSGYGYIHKGFAQLKGGDKKGGSALIKKGIKLAKANSAKDPKNGELQYNIATGYRYLNDHKNAIAHLNKAIKLSPGRKNYQLDLQAIKLEAKMQSNSKKNKQMMDDLENKLNEMKNE